MTDPVDTDLERHLASFDDEDKRIAAVEDEAERVFKESFTPGSEDVDALNDALMSFVEDTNIAGHLAIDILAGHIAGAKHIVKRAISEWCHDEAERRVSRMERGDDAIG